MARAIGTSGFRKKKRMFKSAKKGPVRYAGQPYALKKPLQDSTFSIKLHYILQIPFDNLSGEARLSISPDGYWVNSSAFAPWSSA